MNFAADYADKRGSDKKLGVKIRGIFFRSAFVRANPWLIVFDHMLPAPIQLTMTEDSVPNRLELDLLRVLSVSVVHSARIRFTTEAQRTLRNIKSQIRGLRDWIAQS